MSLDAIPKTQRAVLLDELGLESKARVTEIPVPDPTTLKDGECLIEMEYSGVCHSDLGIKDNDYSICAFAKLPLVGGHEGIGRVIALGPHATSTTFPIGQRVGIKWVAGCCLHCEACLDGRDWDCVHAVFSGLNIQGTFQQYLVANLNAIVPIPDSLNSAAASPLLCAGVTVHRALKQTNTRTGDWIAIPGAGGGLGHLAIQYAISMGLRVIAIDSGADKKTLCQKLGAEAWIDFKESTDIVKDVLAVTGGKGANAALMTAVSGAPYNQALGYLAPKGTLVGVGLPPNAKLNIDISYFVWKGLRFQGSYVGTRQDTVEALSLAAMGKVKPQYTIRPLSEIQDIYEAMRRGELTGRVVLDLKK